jgi:hypothetical protein
VQYGKYGRYINTLYRTQVLQYTVAQIYVNVARARARGARARFAKSGSRAIRGKPGTHPELEAPQTRRPPPDDNASLP